jgi:hypothetical protein
MDELRAEVDHAFAAARAEIASLNGRVSAAKVTPSAAPPQGAQRPPAPPAPTGRPANGSTAPTTPPPPPPTNVSEATMPSVWQAFEHELADVEPIETGDPISLFAPSPRMDWGPDRASLLRRSSFLRRPSGASA